TDWSPPNGETKAQTEPDRTKPGKNPGGPKKGTGRGRTRTLQKTEPNRTTNRTGPSSGEVCSSTDLRTYEDSRTEPIVPPYGRGKPPGRFPSRGSLGPEDSTLDESEVEEVEVGDDEDDAGESA